MLIIVDSEGDPVQEFSALYVNEVEHIIEDVLHCLVCYPSDFSVDHDYFARYHIHGLDRTILSQRGLCDADEVRELFYRWLKSHPYDAIYGHAPAKEKDFLGLSTIHDCQLKPWKERIHCKSHAIAVNMKRFCVPICNINCSDVHRQFKGWKSSRKGANEYLLTATDVAKQDFGHHCSLYDCVEIFLFLILND